VYLLSKSVHPPLTPVNLCHRIMVMSRETVILELARSRGLLFPIGISTSAITQAYTLNGYLTFIIADTSIYNLSLEYYHRLEQQVRSNLTPFEKAVLGL
jgi:hypothetical protein